MNTLDRFGASHTHCTQGCEALDAAVDQIAESGLQLLLVPRLCVVLVVVIDPPLCFKLTNLMKQHQHHLDW